MKKMSVFLLSVILVGSLFFGIVSVNAEQWKATAATFKVYVNGEEFKPSDVPVLVVEGRTMLPLKAIGNALDVLVKWDGENKRVLVGGTAQEENVGTANAVTQNIGISDKIYSAEPATFEVLVNGKTFKPDDVPVLVVEGRTMLPLKAIGDALGVPVKWDSEKRQVVVGDVEASGSVIPNAIVDGNLKITILDESTMGTESVRVFDVKVENTSISESAEFSMYNFGSNIGAVRYFSVPTTGTDPNLQVLEPLSMLDIKLKITNNLSYESTLISYDNITLKVDEKSKTN